MGIIADLSEWQYDVDFAKLSKMVDGVILRVQSGYSHPDKKYKDYVAGCKANGIEFGTYAYFKGVSVPDSIAEAKSAFSLMDKDSTFFALDIEEKTCSDLISAGQAFIDYLRNQGVKNIGLYSGENFYNDNKLTNIKADFIWLANYGANDGQQHTKPCDPCDLWQYTSLGKLDGINTNVDLNVVTGKNPFGTVIVQVVQNSEYVGKTLTSKVDGLWYYNTPKWDTCDGKSNKGDSWIITQELTVNGGRMVRCHDGKYRTADSAYVAVDPEPSDWPYTVAVDGITLKEAQEIVIYIRQNYKNANVKGIAK